MRRAAALLLLLVSGCSTAPIADLLDFFKPGKISSEKAAPYGGVCTPAPLIPPPTPGGPVLPGPPLPPPGPVVPGPVVPPPAPVPVVPVSPPAGGPVVPAPSP